MHDVTYDITMSMAIENDNGSNTAILIALIIIKKPTITVRSHR